MIDGRGTSSSVHRSPTIDGSSVDLLNTLNNSRVDKFKTTTTTDGNPTEAPAQDR